MRNLGAITFIILLVQFNSSSVFAAEIKEEAMKQDNIHVRVWNAFAKKALKLHETLISQHPHKKVTKTGGYSHLPGFYVEEQFKHKEHGKLISQVQWEKENPDVMHTVEVYVRDDDGRVLRDFQAAYLPHYHNAPNQTLISLHAYNDKLHSFRVWDASGYRIFERCMGKHKGKDVQLMLDEDEIANLDGLEGGTMESALYKKCFKGLPEEPGKYLTPQ